MTDARETLLASIVEAMRVDLYLSSGGNHGCIILDVAGADPEDMIVDGHISLRSLANVALQIVEESALDNERRRS